MEKPVDQIVIVGAGQGGFQAAASLRQEGYDGKIILIGEESGLPYQRPPLSKAYLKTGDADGLSLRPKSFYHKTDITYVSGTRVTRIDRTAQRVETEDAAGEAAHHPYDHLILATGTRNARPPVKGLDRTLDLRTLKDAERLRAALDGVAQVAVIGGGFIGLEFAAVARGFGIGVSVAEGADRLMARAVSPQMSQRFLDKHVDLGTHVALGQFVQEVSEAGVHLADGAVLGADLVLLAAGVVPNVELAEAAGLTCSNGVVVDELLLTGDPAISALGDCASFPDPRAGRHVRLESVQAATDHARLIAKRLAKGDRASYVAVPWFWSDQADWKLQIAGLAMPADRAHERADGTVLRFDGDRLTAVETVNNAKVHMKSRQLLKSIQPVTRAVFEASGI